MNLFTLLVCLHSVARCSERRLQNIGQSVTKIPPILSIILLKSSSPHCRLEEQKSEVYHSSDCPLSKKPAQTDNGSHDDQDANGNISRSNSEVSCSCDAEKLKLSKDQDSASDLTNQNVIGMDTTKGRSKAQKESANMADENERLSIEAEDKSEQELDNLFVDTENELRTVFHVGSVEDNVTQSGASSVCDVERKSTSVRAGDYVTGHVGGLCSMDAASSQSRDQSHDRMQTEATVAPETTANTTNKTKPAENISDNNKEAATDGPPSGTSQVDTTATTMPPGVSAEPHTEHGNVIYFQQDIESDTKQQAKSGGSTAMQSIPVPEGDTRSGKEPPTPPNTPGILDRTLGSLSSIGSPISSKLTKVVDFSSGLFVRNTEAQGSVVDFADMYPNTPGSIVSSLEWKLMLVLIIISLFPPNESKCKIFF